jgi:hypothetical protein
MSSQFNRAISVWSVPDTPQFPAEMRGAVILTLDDSGAYCCCTWHGCHSVVDWCGVCLQATCTACTGETAAPSLAPTGE